MAHKNVAIVSIMSQFDEKSVKQAAKKAGKEYKDALNKSMDFNVDGKLLEHLDKTLKLVNKKFSQVNLSAYTNNLLGALFNDEIKEKGKYIEGFISTIERLNKALSGQNADAFNLLSGRQINTIISKQKKVDEAREMAAEIEQGFKQDAKEYASIKLTPRQINRDYNSPDYSETFESLKQTLGIEGDVTAEQDKHIENLAQMVSLYRTMKQVQPDLGTLDAIKYAKNLSTIIKEIAKEMAVVDEFTDNGARRYFKENNLSDFETNIPYNVGFAQRKYVEAQLARSKSPEAIAQADLASYIQNAIQAALEKSITKANAAIQQAEEHSRKNVEQKKTSLVTPENGAVLIPISEEGVKSFAAMEERVEQTVEGVVQEVNKGVDELHSKIDTSEASKGTNSDEFASQMLPSQYKAIVEYMDARMKEIQKLNIDGEATVEQIQEYINLYQHYKRIADTDPDFKIEEDLSDEFEYIMDENPKLKGYADAIKAQIEEDNSFLPEIINAFNKQREQLDVIGQAEENLRDSNVVSNENGTTADQSTNLKIFDEDQMQRVLSVFDAIEEHLSSLRRVISDVGDGEELSPLLSTIDKINTSVLILSDSVNNIGFNMNIDVGTNTELESKIQSKAANALQAYQNLFEHIKMSGAGGSIINTKFFEFDINQYDTMVGKLQAYRKFINDMRKEAKLQYGGYDVLYQDTDKSYWTATSAAMGQVTRAFNEAKAVNDVNPLSDLFGKTDLTEVMSQLEQIVEKLGEISQIATGFKDLFADGLNVSASIEEVEKLANVIKEVEDELLQIKTTIDVDKIGVPSESFGVEHNTIDKTTESIKEQREEVNLLTYETGRLITVYRGVKNVFGGLISSGRFAGGTFGADDPRVAAMYSKDEGKIYQHNIAVKNPLEIEGRGKKWNNISYLGRGETEESKTAKQLLKDYRSVTETIEELKSSGYEKHDEELVEATNRLTDILSRVKEMNHSDSLYGLSLPRAGDEYRVTTNDFVRKATANGFDSVIFKDIIDTWDGVAIPSNVFALLDPSQIKNVKTLSSDIIPEYTKFFDQFPNYAKYVSATKDKLSDILYNIRNFDEEYDNMYPNADDDSATRETNYNALLNKLPQIKDYLDAQKYFEKSFAYIDSDGDEHWDYNKQVDDILNFISKADNAWQSLGDTASATIHNIDAIEVSESAITLSNQLSQIDSMLQQTQSDYNAQQKGFSFGSDWIDSALKLLDNFDNITSDDLITSGFVKADDEALKFLSTIKEIKENLKSLDISKEDLFDDFDDYTSFYDEDNDVFGVEHHVNSTKAEFKNTLLSCVSVVQSFVSEVYSTSLMSSKTYVDSLAKKVLEYGRLQEIYYDAEEYAHADRLNEMREDIRSFSENNPEIADNLSVMSIADAKQFIASQNWYDFLETLPNAQKYLETIGYYTTNIDSIPSNQGATDVITEPNSNLESETALMRQIATSASDASQAKQDFVTANKDVQDSVDESKSPLQLEAELMQQIAKDARDAADAKKEFVEANKQVEQSANDSNGSMNSNHSDNAKPADIKRYKKKGYKAYDAGDHDNEETVAKKSELGATLKKLQSEIIASIDESTSFIKEVTDFYDSVNNLVKTQMKVVDKNGSQRTYTTSYSKDGDDFKAWTSHIDTAKLVDIQQKLHAEKEQNDRNYWQGRFADSIKDLSGKNKNSVLENMKKFYQEQDKENSTIWNDNVAVIQEWVDAQSELNKLRAVNVGKGDTEEIKAKIKEVKELKEQAEAARKTLSDLFSPYKRGEMPSGDWKDMMALFNQGNDGSPESVSKLSNAIKKNNESKLAAISKAIETAKADIDVKTKKRPKDNQSEKYSQYIQDYQNAINGLENEYDRLQSKLKNNKNAVITEEDLKSIERYRQAIAEAQNNLKGVSFKGSTQLQRRKEIDTITKALQKNTKYSEEAKEKLKALIDELKNGDAQTNVAEIHDRFLEVVVAERMAGREGQNFIDILKNKVVGNFAAQLVGYYLSWMDIIRYIKQGIQTIIQYDTALTEMNKVSNESISTLKRFQKESFNLANSVGTTGEQIQNSTADFLRLGESFEQAKQSAVDANALFKVSEFSDISEATDALVAMSQAYDDLSKSQINDVLNYTGKTMPANVVTHYEKSSYNG